MKKRQRSIAVQNVVRVASTLGFVVIATGSSFQQRGILVPRGGASFQEEGAEFLVSFEDEIRRIREEIESETRECFDEQLKLHMRQEDKSHLATGVEKSDARPGATSGPPSLMPATIVHMKKEPVEYASSKNMQQKRGHLPPTPPTLRAVVSVSGGSIKSTLKKSKVDSSAEEIDDLIREKLALQSQSEHAEKALSRTEFHRAVLTASVLLLLCLLMTMALRVVEASLGVP